MGPLTELSGLPLPGGGRCRRSHFPEERKDIKSRSALAAAPAPRRSRERETRKNCRLSAGIARLLAEGEGTHTTKSFRLLGRGGEIIAAGEREGTADDSG